MIFTLKLFLIKIEIVSKEPLNKIVTDQALEFPPELFPQERAPSRRKI